MKLPILEFYCDSSSHRGHKYVVLGGVSATPKRVLQLNAALDTIKSTIEMKGEFKWSGFRGGNKTQAYKSAVDLFFHSIENRHLHFHSIVCDFAEFDHHRTGRGSPEASVNKLYYQLMLHQIGRRYGGSARIEIYPDHGNDSAEVVRFREAICAAAYKKYSAKPNCIRAIKPVPSAKHNILQMLDIVIGSMAALREQRSLATHKAGLADYILEKSPVSNWDHDFNLNQNRFSIWNFGR